MEIIGNPLNMEEKDKINRNFKKQSDGLNHVMNNITDYIKRGSINEDMVSFIIPSKNIFNNDPSNLTNGRVNSLGGITIDPNIRYLTGEPQIVKPSKSYYTNKTIFINFFDKNGDFKKYEFVSANRSFDSTNDSRFIRISTRESDLETLQVEEGVLGTPYERYYRTISDVEFKQILDSEFSGIKNIKYPSLNSRLNDIERSIIDIDPDKLVVDPEVSEGVFVSEMNNKLGVLGGENLNFKNSSGLFQVGQIVNVRDLSVISRYMVGCNFVNTIWGVQNYTIDIKGVNERRVPIETTVKSDVLSDYDILGGKTGTLGIIHNLILHVRHIESGITLVAVVLKSGGDRFEVIKTVLDKAVDKIKGIDNNDIIDAEGYSCFEVDGYNNSKVNSPIEYVLYKEVGSLQSPASLTKVLTSIIAIENASNINMPITITESDIREDSIELFDGDVMTLRDALYLSLIKSNNTISTAISRTVGLEIIKHRGYA